MAGRLFLFCDFTSTLTLLAIEQDEKSKVLTLCFVASLNVDFSVSYWHASLALGHLVLPSMHGEVVFFFSGVVLDEEREAITSLLTHFNFSGSYILA